MTSKTVSALSAGIPAKAQPQAVSCQLCGRTGINNFSLVDRFADGSERWRCTSERTCRERKRRNERRAAPLR